MKFSQECISASKVVFPPFFTKIEKAERNIFRERGVDFPKEIEKDFEKNIVLRTPEKRKSKEISKFQFRCASIGLDFVMIFWSSVFLGFNIG